jgi:AraC-like DNA-binding protein
MMDKTEGGVLAGIPPSGLSLTLTRSTIRMLHTPSWWIDKTNSVHDLVIGLEGAADYRIGEDEFRFGAGEAMLIPAGARFVGRHAEGALYRGVAQHFTLELFGRDLIPRMRLARKIRLSRWALLEPMVRHYHDIAPPSSTTLMQHPLFMMLLVEFLQDAFLGWREDDAPVTTEDRISVSVAIAAARITADPLEPGLAQQVVEAAPYNPDYFRREFRRQTGYTPAKFQEFKRMERAMALLEGGRPVGEAAASVGYPDPYYFSRMFRRYVGTSPSGFKEKMRQAREGKFPRGEEDGQPVFPLARR